MAESFAYHTDLEWFNNIRNSGLKNGINFWVTDRKFNLFSGELFFMKNHKKFIGMGTVDHVENGVKIEDAWNRFGLGNGSHGLNAMIQRIKEVLGDESADKNYPITCIILNEFAPITEVSFDEANITHFQTNKRLSPDQTDRLLRLI